MAEKVNAIKNKEDIKKVMGILKEKNEIVYVFFVLGISTGIDPNDLINLKIKDIKKAISLTKLKVNKKVISLNNDNLGILDNFIKNKSEEAYLFENKRTLKPYTTRSIGKIINDAVKEAGLKYNVAVKGLKKTYAYLIYKKIEEKEGALLATIILKKILGHGCLNRTIDFLGLEENLTKECFEII